MAYRRTGHIRVASESRTAQVVSNGVLGMMLFIITEAMMFAGLISAFSIVRASAMVWPPPGQPRLPLEATAVNTAALLASGFLLYRARRAFQRDREAALTPLLWSMLLGGFFVLFQGYEWVRLIGQGLTLTSSSLGSFFYMIVGIHALHAICALGLLIHTWNRLRSGWLVQSQLATAEVFWYFVVGLWPILYLVVYL
jgi:cytochrome c oxidase subunit 3